MISTESTASRPSRFAVALRALTRRPRPEGWQPRGGRGRSREQDEQRGAGYGIYVGRAPQLELGPSRLPRSCPVRQLQQSWSVKLSAKPTLVRTQHLPPPNPRSGRVPVYPEARSDACPGAVRQTADGFGGPVVGQIWPGQRPAAERARSRASRARFRKADLSGGCSAGHGRVSGAGLAYRVQWCPVASSCDTDA